MRFVLLWGWGIFLGVIAFAIWLSKPGHPFYFSAHAMSVNHRITQEDLIPSPSTDGPPVGRYVRDSPMSRWTLVLPQDVATYPTIKVPANQILVQLDLPLEMAAAVNEGSRIDVWDQSQNTRILENFPVVAVVCVARRCTAVITTDPANQEKLKRQKANLQLEIRSY